MRRTTKRNSIGRGLTALYIAHGANTVIPIVTLPWISRSLGPSNFGQISICIAVASYLVMLTDFGFNLSATRQVAALQANARQVAGIFWNTLFIKLALCAACLVGLIPLGFFLPLAADTRALLALSFGIVLGSVLTPVWYYQGLELQATLAWITVTSRTIYVAAVLALIHGPEDTLTAMLIYALAPVLTGVLALAYLAGTARIPYVRPKLEEARRLTVESVPTFLSSASTNIYMSSTVLIIGALAGATAAGYYSVAEKVIQAAQGVLSPLNQIIFPRVAKLLAESTAEAMRLLKLMFKVQVVVGGTISVAIIFGAPLLVRLAFGPQFEPVIAVLRWLAPVPLLIAMSNSLGVQAMVPLGMSVAFAKLIAVGGLISIAGVAILSRRYGAEGAAMATLLAEFSIVAMMHKSLRSRGVDMLTVGSE